MNIPATLRYTENDEWIRVEGKVGTIGITDFAQNQLSDIVFVEIIASEGDELKKGETCATLESVKAAADVYLPVGGKVIAVNNQLSDQPEKVNSDPYGDAWMVKVEIADSAEVDNLLDASAYEKLVETKG